MGIISSFYNRTDYDLMAMLECLGFKLYCAGVLVDCPHCEEEVRFDPYLELGNDINEFTPERVANIRAFIKHSEAFNSELKNLLEIVISERPELDEDR